LQLAACSSPSSGETVLLDAFANAVSTATAIVAVYGSTAVPIAALDRRDITMSDRVAMQQGAGLLAGRRGAPSRFVCSRSLG
jgi:hypothetical protein